MKLCTSGLTWDIIYSKFAGFLGFLYMPYYPTPQDGRIVESWTRAGIGAERIASRLGVTVETLKQAFPLELGYTDEASLAAVAEVAYEMAISGKHPSMTKFWLEARGGWAPGQMAVAGEQRKPLTILIDPEAVEEAEFTEVEKTNVIELHPDSSD